MKGYLKILLVVALALSGETVMARKSNSTVQSPAAEVDNAAGLGNISKRRREELKQKIGEIKSYLEQSGDTNAVRLLRFAAELEREVGEKKYGLVFEEHRERVDAELEANLPVLTENKKRFIDNGGDVNFLIEGDNLAALKLLEKTHRGRIDVIYIDPPYNTGNKDFVYNDSYVDKTDGYRHSKWLSFMKKRLEIARRLMSEKGVIFISIDDNEQANLKLLCDEVFGEGNFIGQMVWKSKSGGAHDTAMATDHEYILSYALNVLKVVLNNDIYASVTTSYNKQDEFGRYALDRLDKQSLGYQKSLDFPIIGPDGRTYVVEHKDPDNKKARWRWGADTVRERYNELVFIYPYVYTKNYEKKDGQKPRSLLFDERFGRTRTGSTDLKKVIGNQSIFTYPKPVSLLSYLTSISARTNSIILDFFAGSGTTGHAVMKLNAEDGGKRTFILVTNNENGICENVTYERLKRVIKRDDYKARLKYYKIDYVPIAEKVYYEYADDILRHIRELVELENGIDFSHDKSVAIALTTEDAERLMANEKHLSKCRVFYRGHNVVMPLAVRIALEERGIETRIIPTYYYPEQED